MDEQTRILIVDDDPDYVATTRAVLRSDGYALDVAYGGDEALSKMRENPPDLVILDVIMSWPLEGVTVSREMMTQSKLRSIPILMVTSMRDSEYRGLFPQDEYLHIDGWLDKPFAPEKLLGEIQTILARHKGYHRAR